MLMMFYTNMLERSKSAPVQSSEPLYPSGGAVSPHRADTSRAGTRNVRNDIAALVRTDQWNDTSELHHASVPGHRPSAGERPSGLDRQSKHQPVYDRRFSYDGIRCATTG